MKILIRKHKRIVLCALAGIAALLMFLLRGKILNPPERAVRDSLSRIEHLDSSSVGSLFTPAAAGAQGASFSDISQDEQEALRLFFKEFSFRILGSKVDSTSATVKVDGLCIDARHLASLMRKRQLCIGFGSGEGSANADDTGIYSLMKYALSSQELTRTHIIENITVIKNKNGWSVVSDNALKHLLTGGLLDALNDPDLLSPEDVVSVYLDRFYSMTPAEWAAALKTEDLFRSFFGLSPADGAASDAAIPDTGTSLNEAFFSAVAGEYRYKVENVRTEGNAADVSVSITSIDMTKVLSAYRKKLLDYAGTSDAIAADSAGLSGKTAGLFLEALTEDASPKTTGITVHLENDGYGWQITETSGLTNALLGDMAFAVKSFYNN